MHDPNDIPSRFYDIGELNFQDFALEAWGVSVRHNVDVLNCARSFRRVPTEYDPTEYFNLFGKRKLHNIFKFHPNVFGKGQHFYEIGSCTMDAHDHDADYFLFIYLTIEEGDKLIKKYDLHEIR